ncbi:MAG: ABC transporter permease [Planctomycetaceae bacterium]
MNASLRQRLVRESLSWLLLVLALGLVFSRLPRAAGILPLWRPWAELGVLSLGMTAVILTGGIDLSIGSIVTLSGAVLGYLWQVMGWPMGVAASAALLTGTLAGALNGLAISWGMSPLVTTLASMALYSGLAMALLEQSRITGFPPGFLALGNGSVAGLPSQVCLLLVAAASLAVLVHATRFGRYLFSLGDQRQSAEFAGVPVRKVERTLYALNGFLAGLVALWFTARRGAAVADAGQGLELQVIACVVLGGTRVTGGSGSIARTLLGLGILAHLEIGLRLWGNQMVSLPGLDWQVPLTANARLILIGLLVILVALLNERLAPRQRDST